MSDNAQDLGSSNTSKEVRLADMSQPAAITGSAIFLNGSNAHYRYDQQLFMPWQVLIINCAVCATLNPLCVPARACMHCCNILVTYMRHVSDSIVHIRVRGLQCSSSMR